MRTGQKKPKLGWGRVAICILLLFLVGCLGLFFRHTTTTLLHQQAVRWGGDTGRFAQLTAFLPEYNGLTQGTVDGLLSVIWGELVAEGLEPTTPEGAPVFAYSARGMINVRSRDRGPAEIYVTGVGRNFFLFHPVQLISGAPLPVESSNRDLVLINEALAWGLFGATDVAGMELFIEGVSYLIVGVYRPSADFASQTATEATAHMFLYYDAMTDVLGPVSITTVEAVLPNPISGVAETVFREALDEALTDDITFLLVNNTDRYSLSALINVVRHFGQRSMQRTELRLPDWENAARMTEDFAAVTLILMLLLSIYPAFTATRLVILLWRRRKWRLGRYVYKKIEDRRERKREAKWEAPRPISEAEETEEDFAEETEEAFAEEAEEAFAEEVAEGVEEETEEETEEVFAEGAEEAFAEGAEEAFAEGAEEDFTEGTEGDFAVAPEERLEEVVEEERADEWESEEDDETED